MSSYHNDLGSTLKEFQLSENDVTQPITSIHMQEISRDACYKWRYLPVHLLGEKKELVWKNIERDIPEEEGRKYELLLRWRYQEGNGATYKMLINAFLKIECKRDAQYVCGLLKPMMANQGIESTLN